VDGNRYDFQIFYGFLWFVIPAVWWLLCSESRWSYLSHSTDSTLDLHTQIE
jgi:hypothetical protein